MENKTIRKYLEKYAEPESLNLTALNNIYDFVVVVPICNETYESLKSIFSRILEKNILIVVVVNSPEFNNFFQLNNNIFINKIHNISNVKYNINKSIQLIKTENFNDILLIDRNSTGHQINQKQGVGLARKIGCDVALRLFQNKSIKTAWIFTTDADVILPVNYFQIECCQLKHFSAVVLEFEHYSDDIQINALQFYYDFKLRYYQTGLLYSQSSYAYIPLGSTMVLNMQAYAVVRGFPKKNAGEDFYLLNKLAKINPIKYKLDDVVVKIKSRLSDRVPFGTGPALSKIKALKSFDDYLYYNPQCFIYLEKWHEYLHSLYYNNILNIVAPSDPFVLEIYKYFDFKNVMIKSKAQITSSQRWSQFIHQWFDAFRTLKAVHYFDKIFVPLNYKQLLKSDNFAKVSNCLLLNFILNHDEN